MNTENPLNRRRFVQGSLTAAAMIPLGGALASCATGGGGDTGGDGGGNEDKKSDENPFGVEESSSLEAVIFNGGYGVDYVEFAAKEMNKKFPDIKIDVQPTTTVAQQLQPRFVGGNPPDLVDNSGKGQIAFTTIIDQLDTLDDVYDATNYEGTPIADTLYSPKVKVPGTFDGQLKAMNYVMSVFAVWYSGSLFEEKGWQVPKTWDETIDLGAKAKEDGKYLFVWGTEAATYYQTMAMNSAIKEGGDEVRIALGELAEDCWSQKPIQDVFEALETCVKKGYFVPGGAGTQFTQAQAQWSLEQKAILYPSGSWIENEMKKATKEGFQMKGAPEPVVSSNSSMPYEAIRATAGEPFIVPSQGKNRAAAKELMRAMLSKEAATNFCKTRLAPTIVKDLIPEDGFGSSALVTQQEMLTAAGDNTFNYPIFGLYGMNGDQLTVWNSFLSGKLDAKGLTKGLQDITDKVRNDPAVKKLPVEK